jgi:hypothetical protein
MKESDGSQKGEEGNILEKPNGSIHQEEEKKSSKTQ